MKSGVAAMIYGVRALQSAGPFPGRIVVGVLCDEEGMMLGAKAFAATPPAGEVDAVIFHQKNEYFEVREIGEYARVYTEAARQFLTGGNGR